MGYILDDFKKEKPPTCDGKMKKSHDAEAWFLGMNNIYKIHDYSENMKAKITTFSLKDKENIWWEDVRTLEIFMRRS